MSEAAASVAQLIAQLEEARRFWLTLTEDPTRKVLVTRPTEAQMAVLRGRTGMALYHAYADLVSDWKGFSLADLGGEGADRVPFSRAAWDAIWVDKLEWLSTVAEAANKAFVDHRQQQAEDAKN